jgi:hypothetical protein
MPCAMPPLPSSLLTPRAVRPASSSLAPRCVGTMCWHAHVDQSKVAVHPPPSRVARANFTMSDEIPLGEVVLAGTFFLYKHRSLFCLILELRIIS